MRQRTERHIHKPATRLGRSRGQSIIEFTLMLPVMAVVLMGVVDLGRAYYSYITIVNAAREGARYGAAHPPKECTKQSSDAVVDIINHTRIEAASNGGLNPARLTVNVLCPLGYPANGDPYGRPIMVETKYQFQMVTIGLLGGGPIGLYSSTQMQIFSHNPVP